MTDIIKDSIKRTTTAVKATSNFTYGSGSSYSGAPKKPAAKKRDVKQADTDKKSQTDALSVFNPNKAIDFTQMDGGNRADKTLGTTQPIGYKFNLPPHEWSLPVRPQRVSKAAGSYVVNGYVGMSKEVKERSGAFGNDNKDAASFHGLRRGRIWTFKDLNYSLGSSAPETIDTSEGYKGISLTEVAKPGGWLKLIGTSLGNISTSNKKIASFFSGSKPESGSTDAAKIEISPDTKYGFQFLWNPESISNSVSLSQSVTPSSTDVFRASAGIFLSQENVNISLIVDRTNDFACIKGTDSEINGITFKNKDFEKYYKNRYPFEAQQNFNDEITKLVKLGTMADIEYLYKAINGPGLGTGKDSKNWANLLGKETADIGFLTPRIIAVQFGPDGNAISYVGQAMSLSVNHIAFTETMIPIRSQVTLSLMVFSGYGSTAKG